MGKKLPEEISFGEWVHQRRRLLDLTQQELADQVGCARITLRRIESGALKPSKELALILLDKLGASQTEHEAWLRFARGLSGFPEQPSDSLASKPRTNLPTALTSFVGREKECNEVTKLLKSHRLVTLTGTGGIGKTRLSIQTASTLLNQFPDGTWLVELAPLSDPALVPQATINTLGLIEQSGRSFQTILTNFLRAKNLLLVLDNCEHLIRACAVMADTLLQSCPDLHIFATSREALGVPGEHVYLVPSLNTPDSLHPIVDTLSQCEAVHLFMERASLAQPHFTITNENASAVAQICHRLDGIPLAIELAAARLRMLSAEQISIRLDDRFRLLTGGARTVLPRHQTLRALIDWSYDLLSERERILLRRLAVFAGGCTLEAAEQVCAGAGENAISAYDVLDLLTHLVDKSLLAVEEHAGHLRYRILETVRQYAGEKLIESGEGEQIRKRHLDYFLKLALDREKDIYGGRQLEWIECLEEEHSNFQTALGWAFENDVEAGRVLVVALWWSWAIRGYMGEGYEWIQKALTARPDTSDTIRAKLLSAAGWMAQDTKSAATFTEQSVALFRQFNDDIGLAFPLSSMGIDAYAGGDFDKAIALTEESCKLFEKAGNKVGLRHALSILGYTHEAQGNLEKAETLYEQSLALSHEIGDFDGRGWSLNLLGRLALNRGEYLKAMELLSEGLSYSKMAKSKPNIARILTPMGIAASHMGNFDQAINFLEEALSLSRSLGDLRDILYSTRRLGTIVRIAGDYVRARTLFLESLELARQIGDDEELGLCLINLGSLMLARGFPEGFVRLWGATEKMLESFWPHAYSYFRIDIEQAVATVRAALGEETFAALFEEGKKMRLDEAVAYALEGN